MHGETLKFGTQSWLIIGTTKSLRCNNCTQVFSRKTHCTEN